MNSIPLHVSTRPLAAVFPCDFQLEKGLVSFCFFLEKVGRQPWAKPQKNAALVLSRKRTITKSSYSYNNKQTKPSFVVRVKTLALNAVMGHVFMYSF